MDSHPLSTRLRVAGGPGAPRAARDAALSFLDGRIVPQLTGDVELVVSELVTNSVLHADAGPDETISIDLQLLDNRLRIAVVDGGSPRVPHVVPPDPERPGGKGLFLVARLSSAWGVVRERSGRTQVWCELTVAGEGVASGRPTAYPIDPRPEVERDIAPGGLPGAT